MSSVARETNKKDNSGRQRNVISFWTITYSMDIAGKLPRRWPSSSLLARLNWGDFGDFGNKSCGKRENISLICIERAFVPADGRKEMEERKMERDFRRGFFVLRFERRSLHSLLLCCLEWLTYGAFPLRGVTDLSVKLCFTHHDHEEKCRTQKASCPAAEPGN